MTAGIGVDLAPSRLARRAWLLANGLTAAAASACLVALALAPTASRLAAALAAVAAVGLAARPAASRTARLGIDADGTISVDSGGRNQSASVGYCGAQLICLRTAAGRVAVWRDALPATHWRRFVVACRWPHGQGGRPAGKARTK